MSSVRNFRVSINLCQWYHDHRHRARIFIHDDIHTIGDLEKHIEKIFKIQNFHLTSQNEYLPSSEDIRILQKDDTVWVMPNGYEQENIPKTAASAINTTENIVKNKKRVVSTTEDYTEEDLHPAKKKKKKHLDKNEDAKCRSPPKEEYKKKKKRKEHGDGSRKDEVKNQVISKDKKNKNKLNSKSDDTATSSKLEENSYNPSKTNSININKLLPVLQSHINSYNKKVKINLNETSNSLETSSSPLLINQHSQSEVYNDNKEAYKCKGTLSFYKKKVSIPTITDKYLQEKKVNIVKIEYLSGEPARIRELELTKNNGAIEHEGGNNCASNNISGIIGTSIDQNPAELTSTNNDNLENNLDQNTAELEHLEEYSDKTEENVPAYENNDNEPLPNQDPNCITSCTKTSSQVTTKPKTTESCTNKLNILDNAIIEKEFEKPKSEINIDFYPITNSLSPKTNSEKTKLNNSQNKSILSDPKENDPNANKKNIPIHESDTVDLDIEIEKELYKIALLSKEESKIYQSKLSSTIPQISNEPTEVNPSSTETVKEIQNLLNNTKSKLDNQQDNTNSDISVADQNLKHNSSTELEQINAFKTLPMNNVSELELNNLPDEMDLFNKNVSLGSNKEPTNVQNTINETISSSDNNSKDSDTTEGVSRPLPNATILSHGKSSFSRRKRLSGIGDLLGELRTNESLVTGESMDSDHSEFITKRQRKRVRKRKKKNNTVNSNTSLSDSSVVINSDYVPKPIKSRARPTMHLKFEEQDGEELVEVDVIKKGKETEEEIESYVDTSGIENITIDSDVDQSKYENFKIKEEYILKSPSIKNLLPKLGDIIAFKILRITENYTPEISSYIIGKVIEFNTDSKVVLYEILNGIEHCQEPKGILSIDEADENNDSNKREFTWADIIDPRLLFP